MITLSIDVTRLDKTRFKTVRRRDGTDGIFCDLTMIETPDSDYGDYMVTQSTTKEERKDGVKLPILGNAKRWDRQPRRQRESEPKPVERTENDDVPF